MICSDFSSSGLPIGDNDSNMTYLYGVSDFFTLMFEDTSKINLLLEASAQKASDCYSRFLQLTSGISLETIQDTIDSQIELVLIRSTDAVPGMLNVYKLPKRIVSSKYVANRPLLPTRLFETEVDYTLDVQTNGDVYLRLARDIDACGFSMRAVVNGNAKEYALWFTDAAIDERLISDIYGRLINVAPQNSTENFHNFIYGLYFTYVHGPTLEHLRKGLNLSLGIPLSRANENVLDVRKYLNTDQYIVIGSENQYLVPYGLLPSVEAGDNIVVGQEIAQWVQIKDYINDGEWWLNMYIPSSVIPSVPDGQADRYAKKGTLFDELMRNYIKKHTFLVNVKVDNFKNQEVFQQLSEIIKTAKPAYTQPLYIWTVEQEDTFSVNDDDLTLSLVQFRCENLSNPIEKHRRDIEDTPLTRGCPQFIRFNVPNSVTKYMGTDPYLNGAPSYLQTTPITGFINQVTQFRENTEDEKVWLRSFLKRSGDIWRGDRTQVGFFRNQPADPMDSEGVSVTSSVRLEPEYRLIPLYITKQHDIAAKCLTANLSVPSLDTWEFRLFEPLLASEAINEMVINDSVDESDVGESPLIGLYNTLFFRGTSVGYLAAFAPELGWQTWNPSVGDIKPLDFLIGIRILEDVVGIYWATTNQQVDAPIYFPVEGSDPINITHTTMINRSQNGFSNPHYFIRGRGKLDYNQDDSYEIDAVAINEPQEYSDVTEIVYTDKYNPESIAMTRGGVMLNHAMEID